MPIELQQRLSEFSYGYGVTREIEIALAAQGLIPTPFMPSLIHEAKLGFDVAFERPGTPLLLQFKLGQAMQRFVPAPRPNLSKPYWRFHLDTAEPDGQFDLLLKAEQDGADVFYVALNFTTGKDIFAFSRPKRSYKHRASSDRVISATFWTPTQSLMVGTKSFTMRSVLTCAPIQSHLSRLIVTNSPKAFGIAVDIARRH